MWYLYDLSDLKGGPKLVAFFGLPAGLLSLFFGLLWIPADVTGAFLTLAYAVLGLLLVPASFGILQRKPWGRLVGIVTHCGLATLLLLTQLVGAIASVSGIMLMLILLTCGVYLLFSTAFEEEDSHTGETRRVHHPNR